MYWMSAREVVYYGKGQAINPEDPPVYESEASYLERRGLLLPGDQARLSRADFEPEVLQVAAVDTLTSH